MKSQAKPTKLVFLMVILSSVFLNSCMDRCTQTIRRMQLVPMHMDLGELRTSFEVQESKSIEEPGKIALFKDHLFIVDQGEGFHIVDNTDPANPQWLKFVQLKGCYDITASGSTLYANNGPDLVYLDISDLNNITLLGRIENTMNQDLISNEGYAYKFKLEEVIEIVENVNCTEDLGFGFGMQEDVAVGGSNGSAQVGSMSRFIVVGTYLYIVDNESLIPVNIQGTPEKKTSINLQRGGIETITATSTNLFIGSTTGMFIFNHSIDPGRPRFLSVFDHARACDPVVVKDNLAYITTRSGLVCGFSPDLLSVVDISNIKSPQLLATYSMHRPHGLAIDGKENLFICDHEEGLKIFDASDVFRINTNILSRVEGVVAYDVILNNEVAILSAENGVFQYDYTDVEKPILLSTLFTK